LNGGSSTGSPDPRVHTAELRQLRHLLVRLGFETERERVTKSEMETVY
jgi:hypothetical protein